MKEWCLTHWILTFIIVLAGFSVIENVLSNFAKSRRPKIEKIEPPARKRA